jgi:hypothetical protein
MAVILGWDTGVKVGVGAGVNVAVGITVGVGVVVEGGGKVAVGVAVGARVAVGAGLRRTVAAPPPTTTNPTRTTTTMTHGAMALFGGGVVVDGSSGATCFPHSPQKRSPSGTSALQCGHFMTLRSFPFLASPLSPKGSRDRQLVDIFALLTSLLLFPGQAYVSSGLC